MSPSIFNQSSNGDIQYSGYRTEWQSGALKNNVQIGALGTRKVFYYKQTLMLCPDGGNGVFDESDYYASLGTQYSQRVDSKLAQSTRYSDFMKDMGQRYDAVAGIGARLANDATSDPLASPLHYRGVFVEFLDARDGKLDGVITDASVQEFHRHAESGTTYSQQDLSDALIVKNGGVPPSRKSKGSSSGANKSPGSGSGQQSKKKASKSNPLTSLLMLVALYFAAQWALS